MEKKHQICSSIFFTLIFFVNMDAWSFTTLKTGITENHQIKDTVVFAYVASIKNDEKGVLLFVDFIQYYLLIPRASCRRWARPHAADYTGIRYRRINGLLCFQRRIGNTL